MQAVAISGPGADALADRLVAALDGRVGVVRRVAEDGGAAAAERATAADTVYTLGAETWRAAGDGPSLREAVERLAPDHDYALAVDFAAADLPVVAVGGADPPGEVLATVADPAAPTDELVATIDGVEPFETLESLVAAVKRSERVDRAGAIATFTGRVRARDGPDDDRTEYLEFEKYEGVAERRLRGLESELEEREGVLDVRLHHRTGVIPDGEDIVFVVVLAGHRAEAFRTVEDGIDRLKDEVPIFKKEVTESETFWVHERD
jgi:molybdopterin synthase catalytic subunit